MEIITVTACRCIVTTKWDDTLSSKATSSARQTNVLAILTLSASTSLDFHLYKIVTINAFISQPSAVLRIKSIDIYGKVYIIWNIIKVIFFSYLLFTNGFLKLVKKTQEQNIPMCLVVVFFSLKNRPNSFLISPFFFLVFCRSVSRNFTTGGAVSLLTTWRSFTTHKAKVSSHRGEESPSTVS